MILKILGLKNDLRDLTRKIEEAIHNLHAQQREGLGFSDGHKDLSELSELDAPFAKIGTVSEGSPADKAVSIPWYEVIFNAVCIQIILNDRLRN